MHIIEGASGNGGCWSRGTDRITGGNKKSGNNDSETESAHLGLHASVKKSGCPNFGSALSTCNIWTA